MPLYEYKCAKCGNVFEVIQKFSDEPLASHEVCGGAVERLISSPALQFKGSGWYITDYAKGNGANKSAKSTEPSTKTEATPAKTESKPAASSDSSSSTKSSS